MKKKGILNSEISKIVDDLRHTDCIVIGDCGLPIPKGVKEIDVSITLGVPTFRVVLDVVMDNVIFEKSIIANEMKHENPELHEQMLHILPDINYVQHDHLKEMCKDVKAIIRTGENTPYANVILQSAVCF